MKYLVNFRRKQLRNVESFTLIEMLIVLLVISALVLLFILIFPAIEIMSIEKANKQ